MVKKMPSSMVRILNCTYRVLNNREDWNQLLYLLQKASNESLYFREVIDQLSPILAREEDGNSFLDEINGILSQHEKYLAQCLSLCKVKQTEGLMTTVTALSENFIKLDDLKENCEQLTMNMSRVTSSAVLNEIILTGIEVSRKNAEPLLMRKKLPALMQYILYVEETVDHTKKRFPEEEVLLNFFDTQIKTLKEAAGAVYLFLEENEVGNLVVAVNLLDKASGALWAAFSALNQLYIQHRKYSTYPKVDDAFHVLYKYSDHKLTEEDMLDALKKLKVEHAKNVNDIVRFKNNTFVHPSLAEKHIPIIESILYRQDLLLAYMNDNIKDVKKLEEALEKFNNLAKQLEDAWIEFNLKRDEPPRFLSSSNFTDLLETIRSVYEYHMPDFILEQKVAVIDEFQAEFQKRLDAEKESTPETSDTVGKILFTLAQQKEGIEKVYNYLETENRNLLLESYKIIEDTTVLLSALNEQVQERSIKENEGIIICPFCSMENSRTAGNCIKCRRDLHSSLSGNESEISLEITEESESLREAETGNESTGEPEYQVHQTIDSIIRLIEDASNENLKFEECQEMLSPYWYQLLDLQEQIEEQVTGMINSLQDPELTENFRIFKESFDFLQNTMQKTLRGLQKKNLEILKSSVVSLTEAGNRLTDMQAKLEQLINSESVNTFVEG
jgi:hypothetical protein